jgi:hypothetical protein
MPSDIQEHIAENWGDDLMLMDNYDDCIVGVSERFGCGSHVVYDLRKVLNRLIESGMTEEEAQEYYEYNMIGSYVGENTPSFITLL